MGTALGFGLVRAFCTREVVGRWNTVWCDIGARARVAEAAAKPNQTIADVGGLMKELDIRTETNDLLVRIGSDVLSLNLRWGS